MKPILLRASALCALWLSPHMALAQTASDANSSTQFDDIVVTGSPLTRSVDEAITGLSVLSGEELTRRGAATIGQTLKYEPGVSSTQFGAGASRPIIRGQGGDRIRVLTNGIGSIDASSSSPDHAVAVEPAQAERIEVLRGAALLRYGSSGASGVVNVIDGRIPDSVPEGIEGALRIGGSSVDSGHEIAAAFNAPIGEKLVLHLDGTYRDADNYDIPGFAESAALHALEEHDEDEDHADEDEDHDAHEDEHEDEEEIFGTLENSQLSTHAITAGLTYVGNRGFIGFAIQNSESDYGIPAGHEHHDDEEHDEDEEEDHEEEDHEEEEERVTIGLEQTRLDINGALNVDGFFERLQFFAGYADYEHIEFEGDEVGTIFTNEGFEARAEAIQAERNGWKAAYGASLRKRKFAALGENGEPGAEAFVPVTETTQSSLFTFHETEIGDVHLEGAARLEKTVQNNSDTGGTIDFTALSISAGGDIHLSDQIRIGGTLFRTERAPTTEELYSDGPHLATGQYERGDDTLDIETATGVELALRYRGAGHSYSANLFHTDYDDYIYEVETEEVLDELHVFEFIAKDATFTGFEVQGQLDLPQLAGLDLSLDGQASYVRAKTDDGNLPRIPPLSLLAGIDAKTDRYTLRAELDYAAESEDLAEEEIATENYLLTNLFASYNWPAEIGDVTLAAAVENVFDEEARQHTSFLKDEVPLPGRNVKVSLGLKF